MRKTDALSRAERAAKLKALMEAEGFGSLNDLLEASAFDSVSPAICVNAGCTYTTEYEPDQDQGWCEVCDTNTVASALVLAGII